MSDVWQGPGWWLASDGKWYPADAEPGAVYEGELQNDQSTVDVVDPPEPEPVAPEPEPVDAAVPAPVAPPTAEPSPQPAEPVATEAVIPEAPDYSAEATFGADPFAQMPAPVIEEPRVGGWQSVDPTPPPAEPPAPVKPAAPVEPAAPTIAHDPQPSAPIPVTPAPEPTAVENDGWTSAYEERNDGPDVNATVPATPLMPLPEVQIPDVQVPPVQQIPDVQIPDVQAPALNTNPIPVVDAPTFSAPEVSMPDVAGPDVAATPASPVLPIPETPIPEVPAPDLGIPDVTPTPQTVLGQNDATVVRDATIPIERDDAWRKPSMGDDGPTRPVAPTQAGHPGVPDVVDLAIPEEPPPFVPEPQGRRWGLVGAAIVGLLVIAALAWLITSLFNDDNGVDTGEPDDSTTVSQPADDDATATSDASAPSTSSVDEDGEQNQDVSVFALRAGDCIVGDIGAGQVTKVAKVDCEEEHQFEVYREALIESSITSFDEEAISAYAEEVCRTSLEAYIPPDDERGLKFKFLQPTEDSWNQAEDPDRVITCLLFDDDAPLVGRAGP